MTDNKCEFLFKNGRFSFFREQVGGWYDLSFKLNDAHSTALDFQLTQTDNTLTAEANAARHTEKLVFTVDQDNCSLVVRRFVTNNGDAPLLLDNLEDGMLDNRARISFRGMHEYTLRYVHTENMRTEKYPDSRPSYPYVQAVPYQPKRFNVGEANHFPAFIITDENYGVSLVEGDLNQTFFERSWELGLDGPGDKSRLIRTYQGFQKRLMAAPYQLQPGETIEVSRVFYQILENTHAQRAYDDYITCLNHYFDFQGKRSPMLHGSVFCTWNYGTLSNINEKLLRTRAKAIADRIPECTHFLIDDGYQANRNDRNGGLDSFYPDPAQGYDPQLFPNGMETMADHIRDVGLVPCIWFSPKTYLDSQLAQEKPEWLLKTTDGNPAILGNTSYLDLSVPEAKEFFLKIMDVLFVDWGYRGMKFDFMTQWFMLHTARYSHGSGPYWRDFVFSEIRKRIGEDGLLMTCIAMSMGNPFPGQFAGCYRCGCDIHDGTWPEQLKAIKATLPQILLPGRKTFLLNMDSAGFGNNPENEMRLRLTWIFITQGILEIAGPIESLPDHQITLFRKLLTNIDRGHKVRCLDERAFTGDGFPEILSVDYPQDSIPAQNGINKHIAFFNFSEKPMHIGGSRESLGIREDSELRDFWTDEPMENGVEIFSGLAPHSAALIEVANSTGPRSMSPPTKGTRSWPMA